MDFWQDTTGTLRVRLFNPATIPLSVEVTAYLYTLAGQMAKAIGPTPVTVPASKEVTVDFAIAFATVPAGEYSPAVIVFDPVTGATLATATGEAARVYVRTVVIVDITWV